MPLADIIFINNDSINFNNQRLLACAKYNYIDLLNRILKSGEHIDVNHQDEKLTTALMYAAIHDNVEIIQILLANGADRTLTDNHGKTALDYAVGLNNKLYWIFTIIFQLDQIFNPTDMTQLT